MRLKLDILSFPEEGGIPGVAVECVDNRKKANSESILLGKN